EQQRLHIRALAQKRRHLGRTQRLGGGEQQRLQNAQMAAPNLAGPVVPRPLVPIAAAHRASLRRRRRNSGPKVSDWRRSISPCRASSRLEAKLEARTVARSAGLAR